MHKLKKHLKALFWHLASLSGQDRKILRSSATILGLHRIGGSGQDAGLDCSAEFFEALCVFVKSRFKVVDLSQIPGLLGDPALKEPLLAITFDDGYRDNLELGAPILLRHGLPATFFLTTAYLGTNRVPSWDENDPAPHPFLSWDEARELARLGFELGGHTRNHPDLARLPLDEAHREIEGCRADIIRETGQTPMSFAYPFGQPANMSDAARLIVAQAGFSCCVGLFDGINRPGADPYRLNRVPISNWYLSPAHFAGNLLGMGLKRRA